MSRKNFEKQLTQIEHQQAWLWWIQGKHLTDSSSMDDVFAITPDPHHSKEVSQNLSEKISHFLQKNSDDPAIKVEYSYPS